MILENFFIGFSGKDEMLFLKFVNWYGLIVGVIGMGKMVFL